MSDDIKVTDGTILEALNGKIDYDGGNFAGSGLEEVVNNYLAENADLIGFSVRTSAVPQVRKMCTWIKEVSNEEITLTR